MVRGTVGGVIMQFGMYEGAPRAVRPPTAPLHPNRQRPLDQLQPEVAPQVSHLRHVPLRTMVKLPHSGQASPS